jgi:hypothetical protein
VKTKLEEDGDEDGLRYISKAIDTVRKQVCMLSEPLSYYHQLLVIIIFDTVLAKLFKYYIRRSFVEESWRKD